MLVRFVLLVALLGVGCGPGLATSNTSGQNSSANPFGTTMKFTTATSAVVISHPSISLTTNNTVEAWIRIDGPVLGTNGYIYQHQGSSGYYPRIYITPALGLTAVFANGSCSAPTNLSPVYTLAPGVKYHIALTFNTGTTGTMYVNGTQVSTASGTPMTCNATSTYVGNDNSGSNGFPGLIDELRVSNSIRYSTTFTPPSSPFTTDAATALIYHADNSGSSGSFSSTEFPLGSNWVATSTLFQNSPFPL